MKQQTTFRKWMKLISLGYLGGAAYLLMYIRYVFYEQMMVSMDINNTQLAALNTVSSITNLIVTIPGAYLADKLDAKKVLVVCISGVTLLTFIFGIFSHSYMVACVIWALLPVVMMPYWACLIKYINNLGGEDESGSSFGKYYLINGLAGVLGNAIPLWVCDHLGGFRAAMIAPAVFTGFSVVMVAIFLDDEKKLASQGIYLKGDEPIQPKYILTVFKWPGTYMLGFTAFTVYSLYSNVSYFNPYLIDVCGIDPSASSAVSIFRSYGAMIMAPVGGILADKLFKSTSKYIMFGAVVTAALFAGVLLFGPDSNTVIVTIYSLLPSLVIYSYYSIYYSTIRELHFNPVVLGTAVGVSTLFSIPSNIIWPQIFGRLIDALGAGAYKYIFLILVGIAAAAFLNMIWVRSHNRKCLAGKRTMSLHGNAAEQQ